MIKAVDDGIEISLNKEDQALIVSWDLLAEHGMFRTTTVEYCIGAHPEVMERAVWGIWRAHVTGGSYGGFKG